MRLGDTAMVLVPLCFQPIERLVIKVLRRFDTPPGSALFSKKRASTPCCTGRCRWSRITDCTGPIPGTDCQVGHHDDAALVGIDGILSPSGLV